jgi:hypothetical protein
MEIKQNEKNFVELSLIKVSMLFCSEFCYNNQDLLGPIGVVTFSCIYFIVHALSLTTEDLPLLKRTYNNCLLKNGPIIHAIRY